MVRMRRPLWKGPWNAEKIKVDQLHLQRCLPRGQMGRWLLGLIRPAFLQAAPRELPVERRDPSLSHHQVTSTHPSPNPKGQAGAGEGRSERLNRNPKHPDREGFPQGLLQAIRLHSQSGPKI